MAITILLCTLGILITSLPRPATAQFVIASVDSWPDDYGQGLYEWVILENVTGSEWTPVIWESGGIQYYNASGVYNWTAGYGIKLQMYAFLNSTFLGLSALTSGDDLQRMNVTVTDLYDEEVYSEDNLTIFYRSSFVAGYWGLPAELWLYGFETILNIMPTNGQVYTVTFTYELYW